MLFNVLIVIATFLFMEFAAWFAHKYLMHGLLWMLHKDHHQKEPGFFEKNDAFFLIFAIPSWLCIMFGMMNGNDFRVWIGAGIAVYGFAYFVVHDIFIHQRFKILKKANHPYFLAVRRAHRAHHRHLDKEEGECFGMLLFPLKFLKQAKEELAKKNGLEKA
ncbi:MAG TPA: carotene hydroxylase [Microscillaceae bacterium]|nr:carotene hydroxylase [Microscillaceae bacterium]